MDNFALLSIGYFLGISGFLVLNELNYRKFHLKGEITRKFAHFAATLATIPFVYIFDSHWYILILAIIFFIVLLITQSSSILNSIHDIDRPSIGSYLLPVAIYTTFLIYTILGEEMVYILPLLILAISDPLAGLLGSEIEKWNSPVKIFNYWLDKTWIGTLTFLLSSFIISLIALYIHQEFIDWYIVFVSITIALVTTLAELFSSRGSDNITIPLSAVLVIYICLFA